MSSNPFRRPSLKDASSGLPPSRPDTSGTPTPPLSVNTKVVNSLQKHVEFASPPSLISPASYPSSPESTRNSPSIAAVLPSNTDYNDVTERQTLLGSVFTDEDDIAIEQAVQNARRNSEITTYKAIQKDAVKDTLSRFASSARKSATGSESSMTSKSNRNTLDVDAFKRLLLTGESAAAEPPNTAPSRTSTTLTSDSSSTTDTASLSQRSLSESLPMAVEETPRSSIDQEHGEGKNIKAAQDHRQKPPPPKPRYGKPIAGSSTGGGTGSAIDPNREAGRAPTSTISEATRPTSENRDSFLGAEDLHVADVKKRPPTPPMTRRKSQKAPSRAGLARNPSSRYSLSSTDESPSTELPPGRMAPPPPPPVRRTNSQPSRKTAADLPATMEEGDEESTVPIMPNADTAKRKSYNASLPPPPLPPPRRNRGSSRGSTDSQRPSAAQLGMIGSQRSSGEYRRPSSSSTNTESRNVSASSNAADILADLAALQREVDAARGGHGR